VQCAGKSDRLFDLSNSFRAVHLSSRENHSCVIFFAEDFNRSKFVACFKIMNYQAIFKNGINVRLLGKLTQYTVIMFRRNVDQSGTSWQQVGPAQPIDLAVEDCINSAV
jgi:hypothetical protein